jgi:hypothetical protein
MKILGAVLELPAKQHCQSSPFTSNLGQIVKNWQCCLAGSSKMAAMDADYSFYVKTIETYARAFKALNVSAIGRVHSL